MSSANEPTGGQEESRKEPWSIDEALVAVRTAAELVAGPLSVRRYDGVAGAVDGPSAVRLLQMFDGSWAAVCRAAGVKAGGRTTRTYKRTWDRAALIDWVAQYLASPGATGSYADYQQWAKATAEAPSGQTIRNHFGGWSEAKRHAQDSPPAG